MVLHLVGEYVIAFFMKPVSERHGLFCLLCDAIRSVHRFLVTYYILTVKVLFLELNVLGFCQFWLF